MGVAPRDQWGTWPMFISQPIAPVAILFFPWRTVVLTTLLATVLWIGFVRYAIVVPALAFWGAVLVRLKWIASPAAALILWRRGAGGAATVALLWPAFILAVPLGPGRVGQIQKMFMQCLGYKQAKRIESS